jgi:magnesium-transporting ATPase (P-type)
MTKGADSIIQPLLNQQTSQFIDETYNYVTQYANEGLRTLILAQKKINRNEYEAWALRYNEALNKVNNRDEELELVSARMESGMELVGATAIEDKLQDGVSETIKYLRNTGIRVWVLTGDKVETAVNIGFSSGLLDLKME